MTIAEFLTARLDEDEALWRQADAEGLLLEVPGAPVVRADGMTPRRFLADITAKRAIVAECVEAEAYYRAHADAPAGELTGLRTAVRLLAQPYADHPEFDPAWRV